MSGQAFNPMDPATWQLEASSTDDGQREIERQQAAVRISRPLLYILCVLFDLGLIGDGKTYEIPVTTPSQRITVSVKVERR